MGVVLKASLSLCALLAAIAVAGCDPLRDGVSDAAPPVSLPPCEWARTVRVIDGDTIVVRIADVEDKVRYIGVDAPEIAHPTRGVEPFGAEASAANRTLVEGRRVCLESDITDRDRFGRLLRYIWLEDGTLVNEALLARGLAQVVTYPPDVKYVESRYLPAQRAAREAGLGLWSGAAGNGQGRPGSAD